MERNDPPQPNDPPQAGDPPEPDDPLPTDAGEPRPAGTSHDALRALEERLDRASDAAERLIAEAAAASAARAADRPPPAGWQAPGTGSPGGAGDSELLVQLIQ